MSGKTAILADPVFMEHDTGRGHPETSARLAKIYEAFESGGLMAAAERVAPRAAEPEELLRNHTAEHLERIAVTDGQDRNYLDGDTPTSARSRHAALLAAGGLVDCVDAVLDGACKNAFALVRPPGHHAEGNRAMGFCLFNNIAVAARHALDKKGLERVLIVDWDVHHGNGTQDAFYDDPRVLFFSIHRYPFYPGTGGVDEIGSGPGKGYTVNVPLPSGCTDEVYDEAFARILAPVARAYKPELIMVSAGFDSYFKDPLGGMRVTEEGFAKQAGVVLSLAEELCGGKMVATLEGGYNLDGLARSALGVTELMMGRKKAPAVETGKVENFDVIIEKELSCLGDFWPGIGEKN